MILHLRAVLGRDRAITTSTVSFFNMLGRLVATATGQAIFNNSMSTNGAKVKADATPVKVSCDATLIMPLLVAQTFAQEVAQKATH